MKAARRGAARRGFGNQGACEPIDSILPFPTMLRAGYTLSFLDNNDFGTPGYNLQKHAPILNTYLRKVHAAGGIVAYEKAHLASLAKIFIPKFDGLPKEVVRVIVSFWGHAGYY